VVEAGKWGGHSGGEKQQRGTNEGCLISGIHGGASPMDGLNMKCSPAQRSPADGTIER
jgi:hypothetical protein